MATKILLVDDEPDILYLLEIMIESEFEAEIIKALDGKQAQELLEQHPDVTMILSDYNMPKANGGELYKYNIKTKNLPFVLLTGGDAPNELEEFSSFQEDNKLNRYLAKPAENKEIIDAIGEILENDDSGNDSVSSNPTDYKRIKIHLLEKFAHKNYNVFLEIGKGKIIQIASEANQDMKQVIEHYIEKQVQYVFLLKEDYDQFIEHTRELIHNQNSSVSTPEREEVTFAALDLAFSVAQEELDALNISKVHQQLVNKSVEDAVASLKEDKDLFSLLKNFLKSDDYITNHTILNIYFSSYLLSKLNWSNDQTLKQLIFACFYHDLEITDQDLAKVKDLNQLEDEEQKLIVKEHPLKAAKLIEGLKGLNHEAHKVIMDHHERPDGSGFPQGLMANAIPPMSCVFIISHEIVDFLIEKDFQTQYLVSKIQGMEEEFNKGNFKRPFNCMREILLD